MGSFEHLRHRSLRLEPLESRTLLTVSVDVGAHTVFVEGTQKADKIEVKMVGADLSVKVNRESRIINSSDLAQIHWLDIKGLGGNDSIKVSDNVHINALIDGGAGNDTIQGGSGNDDILGGDGNDAINGGNGDDRIDGGNGNDTINGGDGNDTISGDSGNDIISGGAGDDSIDGGAGNDRISGDSGNDTLFGDDGNDTLSGGAGDDSLQGGAGNDSLSGDDGNDSIHGDSGNDRINGGKGYDAVYGDSGNDLVNGNEGDDSIFGGDGNDVINGGAGKDRISGDAGNDVIDGGGRGQGDLIDGGAGTDRDKNGAEVDFGNELRAIMTDSTGAIAKAEYEFDSEAGAVTHTLKVHLEDAAPDTTFDVKIGGVSVGSITTNAVGRGRLILEGDQVPAIAEGTTIQIGDTLSGAFAGLPDTPDHDQNGQDQEDSTDVRLAARMTDATGAHAEVEWRVQTEDGAITKTLKAEVEGAAPNTTLDVLVNGVSVGSIATNSRGHGTLVLSAADLPENFDVALGQSVQIGTTLSGIFVDDSTGSGDNSEIPGQSHLQAVLGGEGSDTLKAKAEFELESRNGVVTPELKVEVEHAAAGQVLDVIIAGTRVGSITADASGEGKLILSAAEFPSGLSIAAGTSIQVGSLQGAFVAAE